LIEMSLGAPASSRHAAKMAALPGAFPDAMKAIAEHRSGRTKFLPLSALVEFVRRQAPEPRRRLHKR
jgi:hypothetical protein